MIESEISKKYCQSCGMPLRFDVEKYLGTNFELKKKNFQEMAEAKRRKEMEEDEENR